MPDRLRIRVALFVAIGVAGCGGRAPPASTPLGRPAAAADRDATRSEGLAEYLVPDEPGVTCTCSRPDPEPCRTTRASEPEPRVADMNAADVAVSPDGSYVVLGTFTATLDVDLGPREAPISSRGGSDLFVLKMRPDRSLEWVRTFGSTASDQAGQVAVGSDGAILVTGALCASSAIEPDAPLIEAPAIVVARLEADGTTRWVRSYAAPGGPPPRNAGRVQWRSVGVPSGVSWIGDLAVSRDGRVAVTGAFEGTVDFDPGDTASEQTAAGDLDGFALVLDPAGRFLWARAFGERGTDWGSAIAFGPDDGVIEAGVVAFDLPLALDRALLFARDDSASSEDWRVQGQHDIVLASLDRDGAERWRRTLGGPAHDTVASVALLGSGETLALGTIGGAWGSDFVTVFGRALRLEDMRSMPTVADAVFGAALSPEGALEWAVAPSDLGAREVLGSDVSPDGSVLALLLRDADRELVSLAADGRVRWSLPAWSPSSQGSVPSFESIAAAPDGAWVLGGSAASLVDLDPDPARFRGLVPRGFQVAPDGLDGWDVDDALLVRLDSSGRLRWASTLAAANVARVTSVAVGADGSVAMTGSLSGTADIDPGRGTLVRTSAGVSAPFVVELSSRGTLAWSATLDCPWDALGEAVTVALDGAVTVAVDLLGPAPQSQGADVEVSGRAVELARYQRSGTLAWTAVVDRLSAARAPAIESAGDGSTLIAGPAIAEGQAVVARIAPGGELSWRRDLSKLEDAGVVDLATDGAGAALVTVQGPQLSGALPQFEPFGFVGFGADGAQLQIPAVETLRLSVDGSLRGVVFGAIERQGEPAALVDFTPGGQVLWKRETAIDDPDRFHDLVVGPAGETLVLASSLDCAIESNTLGEDADVDRELDAGDGEAGSDSCTYDDLLSDSACLTAVLVDQRGETRWSVDLPDLPLRAAAVSPLGATVLVGTFGEPIDVDPDAGEARLVPATWSCDAGRAPDRADLFIVELDRGGQLAWAAAIGTPDLPDAEPAIFSDVHVEALRDGSVVLAVVFRGTIDVDPGPRIDSRTASTRWDVAVVRLARQGALQWAVTQAGPPCGSGVWPDPEEQTCSLEVGPAIGFSPRTWSSP
jgi:hypothetical protein